MNPIENMTLREIIRSLPLGIGILEELTDGAFWGRLDTSVADFCRDAGLDIKDLQHRFGSLPANLERQDWRELPLYFLVDHLTANHREFRARYLPEIHRQLEELRAEFPESQGELSAICDEFKEFRRDFGWHMDEEEEFIFPKILRTEASLRHPEMYPEVFKGSIRMFSKIQLHDPEETFHELVSGLALRLRGMVSDLSQLPVIRNALSTVQAYEARLRAHTFIESEILFRRALEMEESLLRRVA
jgi:iron-sulfur cluster repair protein YtfE (RIC family)